jgi:hypothetical protein
MYGDLQGIDLQTTYFPHREMPDWLYTTSENGWTSHKIGSEQLRRVFIPETQPDENPWRILTLDGHGPHILQPLDLALFSVLKSGHRVMIKALSALDDAALVKTEHFISSYSHARETGLSQRIIRANWRATGICPYHASIVIYSSQVPTRAITPPPVKQPQSSAYRSFSTPKRAQDIYQAQQQLLRSENLCQSGLEDDTWMLRAKTVRGDGSSPSFLHHCGTKSDIVPEVLWTDRVVLGTRGVGHVGGESNFLELAFVGMGLRKTQAVTEHDFVWNKVLVYHVVYLAL